MKNRPLSFEFVCLLSLIVLGAMVLLLSGCRPTKELTTVNSSAETIQSSTETTATDSTAVNERIEQRAQVIAQQWVLDYQQEYNRTISAETTKYDTSKPIVPETGKPPVLEETKYNSNEDTKTLRKENESLHSALLMTTRERDSIDVSLAEAREELSAARSELQAERTKEIGLTGWQSFQIWCGRILLGAVVILILGGIIRIKGSAIINLLKKTYQKLK